MILCALQLLVFLKYFAEYTATRVDSRKFTGITEIFICF